MGLRASKTEAYSGMSTDHIADVHSSRPVSAKRVTWKDENPGSEESGTAHHGLTSPGKHLSFDQLPVRAEQTDDQASVHPPAHDVTEQTDNQASVHPPAHDVTEQTDNQASVHPPAQDVTEQTDNQASVHPPAQDVTEQADNQASVHPPAHDVTEQTDNQASVHPPAHDVTEQTDNQTSVHPPAHDAFSKAAITNDRKEVERLGTDRASAEDGVRGAAVNTFTDYPLENPTFFRRLRNDDSSLSVEDFSVDETEASGFSEDISIEETTNGAFPTEKPQMYDSPSSQTDTKRTSSTESKYAAIGEAGLQAVEDLNPPVPASPEETDKTENTDKREETYKTENTDKTEETDKTEGGRARDQESYESSNDLVAVESNLATDRYSGEREDLAISFENGATTEDGFSAERAPIDDKQGIISPVDHSTCTKEDKRGCSLQHHHEDDKGSSSSAEKGKMYDAEENDNVKAQDSVPQNDVVDDIIGDEAVDNANDNDNFDETHNHEEADLVVDDEDPGNVHDDDKDDEVLDDNTLDDDKDDEVLDDNIHDDDKDDEVLDDNVHDDDKNDEVLDDNVHDDDKDDDVSDDIEGEEASDDHGIRGDVDNDKKESDDRENMADVKSKNGMSVIRADTRSSPSAPHASHSTQHAAHSTQHVAQQTGGALPPDRYKSGAKRHVCDKCGSCHALVEHLLAHYQSHPVGSQCQALRCDGCGVEFMTCNSLACHMELSRSPHLGFRCSGCGRWFGTCDDLFRHRRSTLQGRDRDIGKLHLDPAGFFLVRKPRKPIRQF